MADPVPERTVILMPGARYGTGTPLLTCASEAARARGARILRVEWTFIRLQPPPDDLECAAAVAREVLAVLGEPPEPPAGTVLVGKSLASYAATVAARHGLPAIWITPLLDEEHVVSGLRQSSAPYLLVGGTADPTWNGELARSLSPHVLEIDGADHDMHVPGPIDTSTAILGRLVAAVERFLDTCVWPPE